MVAVNKYLRYRLLLFACSEEGLRRTSITVRNELPRNIPPELTIGICQIGPFEEYLSLSFH